MNVLLHLMIALLVSAVAESGVRISPTPSWATVWGVPWTALLWPLAAWPLANLARPRVSASRAAHRLSLICRRLLSVWPVVAHAGAVMISGWLDVAITQDRALVGWPAPAIVLLFVPFALAVLASADASFGLAYRGVLEAPLLNQVRRAVFLKELRLLAVAAAPLLLYAVFDSVVRRDHGVRAMLHEVALFEWLDALVLVVLFGAVLPRLLRLALGLRRVRSGRLLQLFDDVARRLGFRGRGLFLWRTGGTEINAAVVGFASWHRFVLVTDGLLAELPNDETRALFGHEMGHTARRHVSLFLAFTTALFVPALLIIEHLGEASSVALWAPLVLIVGWYFGFGWLSRRAELDADLVAVAMAGGPGPLERLLSRTAAPQRRHKNGWRHFGAAQRAIFARAAHRHVEVGLRLRRTLDRVRLASVLVATLALTALFFHGLQSFDADLARAHLRTGAYGAALERAKRVEDPTGVHLAGLAETATQLFGPGAGDHSTRVAPEDLENAAEAAFARRDYVRARQLIELALWRSGGRLGERGRAIDAQLH